MAQNFLGCDRELGATAALRVLLTDAGNVLQPILVALKEWGEGHCNPGAEPIIFQQHCGADFHPLTVCGVRRARVRGRVQPPKSRHGRRDVPTGSVVLTCGGEFGACGARPGKRGVDLGGLDVER